MKKLTYENITHAKELSIYLEQGNKVLDALGYSDHSQKHTAKVAVTAGRILKKLGYDEHTVELARIAGYMHDIGNSINRVDHAHTGALMAFQFLRDWGAPPEDIAAIISAIGQHDERSGVAFDPISQPSSWQTRATSAATAYAIRFPKPSINTTGSIMPLFRLNSTSTATRTSSAWKSSSMNRYAPSWIILKSSCSACSCASGLPKS